MKSQRETMKRTTVGSWNRGIIVLLLLALIGCSDRKGDSGKGGAEQPKSIGEGLKYGNTDVLFVAQTRILGTIDEDASPTSNAYQGHNISPTKPQEKNYQITFNEQGRGVAFKAEKGGKIALFFNGKAGPSYNDLGEMVISPDGRRFAYTAQDDRNIWRLVIDGRDAAELHHLGTPVFSPDSRHVAVQASANEDWFIVMDGKPNKKSKYSYDRPVFSADSMKIAYIENLDDGKKRLYIADLQLKNLRIVDSVVSPIVTSPDRKQLAVVIARQDKQRIARINFDNPDLVNEGSEYDSISNVTFGPEGRSIAYTAMKGGVNYLVLDNTEAQLASLPVKPMAVNPVRQEVAIILASTKGMRLHRVFAGVGDKGKNYDDIAGLVYSNDGSRYAYAATKGKAGFIVINGKEGPHFDKVVAPLITHDGKRVIYRARKDGKRFVVVADNEGKTLKQHPPYQQVFQPVLTPDGKSVAYGVQDGKKLVWMVEKL